MPTTSTLPVPSRNTVQRGTEQGLTSGFGMSPGVSPAPMVVGREYFIWRIFKDCGYAWQIGMLRLKFFCNEVSYRSVTYPQMLGQSLAIHKLWQHSFLHCKSSPRQVLLHQQLQNLVFFLGK